MAGAVGRSSFRSRTSALSAGRKNPALEKDRSPDERRRRAGHERRGARGDARRAGRGWEVFGVRNGYAGLARRRHRAARRARRRRHHPARRHGARQRALPRVRRARRARAKALANLRAQRHRRAGRDRRQRLADRLGEPRARGLRGGRRAFHHRQRPLRHRRQHRLRHGDQRHARGDRPPAHHRLVAPARLRGRDDGPRLRLHRADVRHRRRRRGDRAARAASSRPRRWPSGCAPPTSAARPTRSW